MLGGELDVRGRMPHNGDICKPVETGAGKGHD